MIPALFALPMAEGIVGQVIDSLTSPSSNAAPAPQPAFTPALNSATSAQPPVTAPTSSSGTMRADEWSQMADTDIKNWASSLAGRHVDVTDASGRTISGTVNSVQASGNSYELNIGGHLVTLSSLKQISWSPSV